jgi:hypothetical protein
MPCQPSPITTIVGIDFRYKTINFYYRELSLQPPVTAQCFESYTIALQRTSCLGFIQVPLFSHLHWEPAASDKAVILIVASQPTSLPPHKAITVTTNQQEKTGILSTCKSQLLLFAVLRLSTARLARQ